MDDNGFLLPARLLPHSPLARGFEPRLFTVEQPFDIGPMGEEEQQGDYATEHQERDVPGVKYEKEENGV